MNLLKIIRTHKVKAAITIAALVSMPTFYAFRPEDGQFFEISKNLDIFTTLYRELNLYYVDETKPGDLIVAGIEGMLESLDPYTNFIAESDIEDYRFMTTGQYGGIGAIIRAKDGKVVVAEPYENSPAAKAGLMAGDVLLEVNGKSTEGKSYEDISAVLKGQPGTEVRIVVERPGKASKTSFTITREEIKVKAVQYAAMVDEKIGYINLGSFTDNCSSEVKEAFQSLKAKNKMQALILDLRSNPGGLLKESVSLCNLFIEKGQTIVYTKGKVQEWNAVYKTPSNPIDTEIPIVVLVNSGSASASEIVSGTLQDLDRGVIIGQRTFGKGLVQTTRPLSYNTQLKVTTAKYYIPSGRCIQAINYAERNEDGSVKKVPDSLISRFYTLKNKRPVYDGGGILPDILTEQEYFSELTKSLVEKNIFFDFATEFRTKNTSISSATAFEITDNLFNEFKRYAMSKEFSYETQSEKHLKELKAVAEKEKYFERVKTYYETMLNTVAPNKEKDMDLFRDEIQQVLKSEITSRYYYAKGRAETMLKDDPDVLAAVKVLSDPAEYKRILTDSTDKSPLKDKVKDKTSKGK